MSFVTKFSRRATDYHDPNALGSRMRAHRIRPLLDMIQAAHAQVGQVRIIDIGGTRQYWGIVPDGFLDDNDVIITVVNLPGSEIQANQGRFEFIAGDGCDLGMVEDRSYDIAHSNSVIEHVGDADRQLEFSREVARVAPAYFVQTPNFWFPIEPHFRVAFFHWLPQSARAWLLMHFDLGEWGRKTTEKEARRAMMSATLLNRAQMRSLFPEADMITERFFGLPKSLIAVKGWVGSPTSPRGSSAPPRRA